MHPIFLTEFHRADHRHDFCQAGNLPLGCALMTYHGCYVYPVAKMENSIAKLLQSRIPGLNFSSFRSLLIWVC